MIKSLYIVYSLNDIFERNYDATFMVKEGSKKES